jgi:ElaB/YqjD/DUF883 family membrane-anchored ribosome-binding protein
MSADDLPEGTDHIINGASVRDDDGADTTPPISAIRDTGEDVKGAFFEKIDELRGQATDKARELATTGKDRATTALDSLVQTVEDAASEIDEKLGSQYGDYARRAAEHIGGFTDSFRDKDIDALFNDARDLVKKSPAVAIGAAAALGFVVARLARSSMAESAGKDAPKA